MKKIVVFSLLAVLAVLLGCSGKEDDGLTGGAVAELPAAEPVAEEPEEEPVEMVNLLAEVMVYGDKGFEPAEIVVNSGETVRFTNANTRKRAVVIDFQKEGTQFFFNSDVMEYGQTWGKTFNEPGTYLFWTEGFVPKGKLVVE